MTFPAWTHLDSRIERLVAQHGELSCSPELVFDGQDWVHITACARLWNPQRAHFVQVRSAKNQKWQLPGAHGEGNFDLKSVALREAKRALGLSPDVQLCGGEAVEVLNQQVEEYWNTPAHLHLEVVFEFYTEKSDELPPDARWLAVN